jgi:hypothetical protein
MEYETILKALQQVGFPIAVSLYLMIRFDGLLRGIRDELIKNGDALKQLLERKSNG